MLTYIIIICIYANDALISECLYRCECLPVHWNFSFSLLFTWRLIICDVRDERNNNNRKSKYKILLRRLYNIFFHFDNFLWGSTGTHTTTHSHITYMAQAGAPHLTSYALVLSHTLTLNCNLFSVPFSFVLNILSFRSAQSRTPTKCVMNDCGVIGNCFHWYSISLYLNNAIKSFNLTYFSFYYTFYHFFFIVTVAVAVAVALIRFLSFAFEQFRKLKQFFFWFGQFCSVCLLCAERHLFPIQHLIWNAYKYTPKFEYRWWSGSLFFSLISSSLCAIKSPNFIQFLYLFEFDLTLIDF